MDLQQQYLQQHKQDIVTRGDILQQLRGIYGRVLQEQRRQLNELLNLQKLLNNIQSTTIIRQNQSLIKNNNNKQTKQQHKQFNLQRIQQKISSIIDQTEDIFIIDNDANINNNNNQKINNISKKQPIISIGSNKLGTTTITTLNNNKYKKEQVKGVNPIIDKKSPLPTINRSNNVVSNSINQTKYIAPRNKNEVTGKVTQTKILTHQKIFKPQSNHIKSNHINNNKQLNNKQTNNNNYNNKQTSNYNNKLSSSVQKKSLSNISTSNNNNVQKRFNKQTVSSSLSSNQASISSTLNIDIDENSISQYKRLRANAKTIKMKHFSKPIEQIAQQIKRNKQTSKKKFNFKLLIQKYQNQFMGHKNIQQKRRLLFIKKFNNFSLSINKSNSNQITNSIPKRIWKQYPYIFQFNHLLQSLEQGINTIQEQYKNDFRIDPKQAYRLQYKLKLIGLQLQKIKQSTLIQVPQKLQLSFKSIAPIQNNKKGTNTNNGDQQEQVSLYQFYNKLINMLKQIQCNQSLSIKDLSMLRVISEIGLYNGKRSPLIVKADQFQQWKQSYQNVNDRQSTYHQQHTQQQ